MYPPVRKSCNEHRKPYMIQPSLRGHIGTRGMDFVIELQPVGLKQFLNTNTIDPNSTGIHHENLRNHE